MGVCCPRTVDVVRCGGRMRGDGGRWSLSCFAANTRPPKGGAATRVSDQGNHTRIKTSSGYDWPNESAIRDRS